MSEQICTPWGKAVSLRTRSAALVGTTAGLLVLLAACGGPGETANPNTVTSEPYSSVGPWIEPTATTAPATPQATPAINWSQESTAAFFEKAFKHARHGGVPEAAKYAGTLHPLAFVGPTTYGWEYDIQSAYRAGQHIDAALLPNSMSQVQLAGFVSLKDASAGSCGNYITSNGKAGEVLRSNSVTTIVIVEAQTGKTVASRNFVGKAPKCESGYSDLGPGPPWYLRGVPPRIFGDKVVDDWIASFLHGSVRT